MSMLKPLKEGGKLYKCVALLYLNIQQLFFCLFGISFSSECGF